MRKLLLLFLLFLTCLSFAQEKETFDDVTYISPKGWTKTTTNNLISFVITDNENGRYCQMGLYKATVSKGSIAADFSSEWDELIVKPFKPIEPATIVETASGNGWDFQTGSAPFEFDDGHSVAVLVTMSGFGRCMSIVITTNTLYYQPTIEAFLNSVEPKRVESVEPAVSNDSVKLPIAEDVVPDVSAPHGNFQFSTTNFDDGWTSTIQEDWVEVSNGKLRVLIHYPNEKTDAYNTDLLDKVKNSWDVLVAPRYRSVSNLEFRPVSDWQTVEFAEANAVENRTGKSVYVVLFRFKGSSGLGPYMEFITPDKATFEQTFGAYHADTSGWEKVENMSGYNKFAVASSDLKGTWSNQFSGSLHYVNANTGAFSGMSTHTSGEKFEFGAGNTYKWSLGAATGMVGNLKITSVKSNGNFSTPDVWHVSFSDIEGKAKTYNAHFACVKGGRILWLGDTGFGRTD